ncbi:IS6 family transposase [Paraburkholderia sp. BR14261]
MKALSPAVAKVLQRLHYPLEIMLVCVRWYVAYPLSLRNLQEMRAERGIAVDHSTVHRGAIKLLPVLEKAFRRCKRPVGKSWRVDETYAKVRGQWKYLYRAGDKAGKTVDFLLRAHRDKAAARRYFEKAIDQNGEPETITMDKSGANLDALHAINAEREAPIKIRQIKYLNNVVRTYRDRALAPTAACLLSNFVRRVNVLFSRGELRGMSHGPRSGGVL